MIVVIEGADGVGKTTCIKTLIEKYGYKQFPVAFPTYKNAEKSLTPKVVLDTITGYLMEGKRGEISDFMFQMANVFDKVIYGPVVEDLNKSKDIYLIDRYRTTGYVYGVASMLDSKELDEKTLRFICEESLKLIPTVTLEVLLWATPETLMSRINVRNESKSAYEKQSILEMLCGEYERFYLTHPMINHCTVWAEQEPDVLAACVNNSIRAFLDLTSYVDDIVKDD